MKEDYLDQEAPLNEQSEPKRSYKYNDYVDQLQCLHNDLENRLQPILIPEHDQLDEKSLPIATDQLAQLDNLCSRFSDLVNRVDL